MYHCSIPTQTMRIQGFEAHGIGTEGCIHDAHKSVVFQVEGKPPDGHAHTGDLSQLSTCSPLTDEDLRLLCRSLVLLAVSSGSDLEQERFIAIMSLPTLPKIYNVYFVAIIATLGGMLCVRSLP